mgnify:CR=1 FL=1
MKWATKWAQYKKESNFYLYIEKLLEEIKPVKDLGVVLKSIYWNNTKLVKVILKY